METRIGISGWRYGPWRKIFYPRDLPQSKELYFASRELNSIEINGTFYASQSPKSFQKWYAETPSDFIFSIKGPRYITHIRRLRDIETPLANFFGSGVLYLEEKLGPILWQFPPSFCFEEERIEDFFRLLPRNFKEAHELIQKADRGEKAFPEGAERSHRVLRYAMEVRHHSFENPAFIDLLRRYDIALVLADTAGRWPYMEDLTSNFIYLRLHGDEELYAGGYGAPTLRWWADRIKIWRRGREPKNALTMGGKAKAAKERDIYLYFDNDIKIKAPFDAKALSRILSKS